MPLEFGHDRETNGRNITWIEYTQFGPRPAYIYAGDSFFKISAQFL